MNCTLCSAPIPAVSDQYGPIHAPVCLSCWLAPAVGCPFCEDGENTCSYCGGDGFIPLPYVEEPDDWPDCPDCNGRGSHRCTHCGGRNMIAPEDLYHISDPAELARISDWFQEAVR